jgi:hypothetical protein
LYTFSKGNWLSMISQKRSRVQYVCYKTFSYFKRSATPQICVTKNKPHGHLAMVPIKYKII